MRISFTRLLNGLREYLKSFLYSSFMDWHMSMHMRISLLNGLRVYLKKKKRFSIFVFHGLAHYKNYTPVIFVPIYITFKFGVHVINTLWLYKFGWVASSWILLVTASCVYKAKLAAIRVDSSALHSLIQF